MPNSLYTFKHSYTDEANEISRDVRALLLPIFSKYIDEGISPRELSHLFMGIIFEIEVMNVALKRKQVQTIIDNEATKKKAKEKANAEYRKTYK